MTTNTLQRGFTLVEMLIYIGMMTFLTAVIMGTIVSITKLTARQSASSSTARSVLVALNRIDNEVHASDEANASGDTLTLSSTNDLGTVRTVVFSLAEGAIVWSEDGEDRGALTETGTEVTDLAFSTESASSTKAVHTTFTLNATPYSLTSVIRHAK